MTLRQLLWLPILFITSSNIHQSQTQNTEFNDGSCLHGDDTIANSEEFKPEEDPCAVCLCQDGQVTCKAKVCEELRCSISIKRPNECCPKCVATTIHIANLTSEIVNKPNDKGMAPTTDIALSDSIQSGDVTRIILRLPPPPMIPPPPPSMMDMKPKPTVQPTPTPTPTPSPSPSPCNPGSGNEIDDCTNPCGCPAGERGPPGPHGRRGKRGKMGPKGVQGEPGPPGRDGKDSLTGIPGPQGPPGIIGEKGKSGPGGVIGSPGKEGLPGLPGLSGSEGSKGTDGKQGRRGKKGDRGEHGPIGPTGARGLRGPDGPPGHNQKGYKGDIGIPGRRGPEGPVGTKGVKGDRGEAGKTLVGGRFVVVTTETEMNKITDEGYMAYCMEDKRLYLRDNVKWRSVQMDTSVIPFPTPDKNCPPCNEENPKPICGNGMTEDGEQCDDGNTDPSDSCIVQNGTKSCPHPNSVQATSNPRWPLYIVTGCVVYSLQEVILWRWL